MFKLKIKRFFIFSILFLSFPRCSFCREPDPQELETLVITKEKSFLFSGSSARPEQAGAFHYQSALETLAGLPVDLESRALAGGIQSDFSLRGSTFSQVLILLNGQRINDPQTAHHNSDIPFTKEDIKRIEVIPGAGSALFGPDAIAGAVDFVLQPPKERKIVLESAAGTRHSGYGLLSVGDKVKDFGFRFSVEEAKSGGFRYDTDFEKFTASLATRWELPLGSWENDFGYQRKAFGAYDFYTPGLGYPSFEWTRTYLFNSGLSLEKDGILVKPNFLWRRHFDKFALNRNLASYNDHHTDMFVPGIYFQKEAGVLGKTGIGLEWGQERIISSNLGKHTRDYRSIYLDDSAALSDRVDLGFSLRLDDFSDFRQAYTGSANLKFKLNAATALNLGISRSLRIPSFTELYYNDPTTLGNPDLAPEKAWNYQAGLEYKQEGYSSGLVFFFRQENKMIDWVKKDPAVKWQPRNFTADNVFGLEYSLHKTFNRLFSLDANYTYTDKVVDRQGYLYKYGLNYARHLARTVFNFDLPFGRQEIGLDYKQQPGRRGWLLLNAGLNYALNKNTDIFINAANIFNVEYQDIPGIPQSGRSVQAGLRWEW